MNYKNTKTKRILGLLKHRALTAMEILEAILPTSRDTYKVTKNMLGYMDVPRFDYKDWQRQEEKKFYVLLAKMRREALIVKRKIGKKTFWESTGKGLKRLGLVLKSLSLNLPEKNYKKEKSNDLTLIVFDIPEKFKYKRVWLRKYLRNLGFQMLQRSVWIGKYKIPEDFIHDLRELKILSNTHILKIQKTGSLVNFDL